MRKPYLWEPGKRTLSQFHRQARAANLAYFASAPLGIPQALTGLLVMAAPDTPAPKDILSLTHVTAATLTTIIEHHSQTTHLSEQVRQQVTALATKHTVQSNTKESIILVTHDFAILELNPAAEITLGYATNEVRGQPVENILVGAETLAPALLRAREGVPTHDLGNMTLHRRNGQAFPAHIRTIPSQSRKPVDVVVILFQDLSEREGLRLRTQQLEQRALLGEVTAIFAHEVRNPINNISTGLQLMALDLPEND
ncbi:MAG: PAS domain-containing protein, partial [Gammaproteobacteria bacterium]|nr:PAS domain-containing protein [Gammaproteobacteria bacterium]